MKGKARTGNRKTGDFKLVREGKRQREKEEKIAITEGRIKRTRN